MIFIGFVSWTQHYSGSRKSKFQCPNLSGLQCNETVEWTDPLHLNKFQSPNLSGLQCNGTGSNGHVTCKTCFSPLIFRVSNVTAPPSTTAVIECGFQSPNLSGLQCNGVMICYHYWLECSFSPLIFRVSNVTDRWEGTVWRLHGTFQSPNLSGLQCNRL